MRRRVSPHNRVPCCDLLDLAASVVAGRFTSIDGAVPFFAQLLWNPHMLTAALDWTYLIVPFLILLSPVEHAIMAQAIARERARPHRLRTLACCIGPHLTYARSFAAAIAQNNLQGSRGCRLHEFSVRKQVSASRTDAALVRLEGAVVTRMQVSPQLSSGLPPLSTPGALCAEETLAGEEVEA